MTKVYLPILPHVLPVVVGRSANLTLTDPPILVPSEPSTGTPPHQGRSQDGRIYCPDIGILSPPGDGMVIITLLTQVRKEKNGKINFRLGIKPGTQRLGVQYTRHQAITQDKSLSPHSSLCTASGRWQICQPDTDRPPNSCIYISGCTNISLVGFRPLY